MPQKKKKQQQQQQQVSLTCLDASRSCTYVVYVRTYVRTCTHFIHHNMFSGGRNRKKDRIDPHTSSMHAAKFNQCVSSISPASELTR